MGYLTNLEVEPGAIMCEAGPIHERISSVVCGSVARMLTKFSPQCCDSTALCLGSITDHTLA